MANGRSTYIHFVLSRRKRVDSGAESEQKETPRQPPSKGWSAEKKQSKNFHFKKKAGRGNYHVVKSEQNKASSGKDDTPNFKSKSKWQPGNGQRNKGDKLPGSNKRTRDGTLSKIQDRGSRAHVHSRGFKTRKSVATT
jgi:ribosomal RNA-processing protein 12